MYALSVTRRHESNVAYMADTTFMSNWFQSLFVSISENTRVSYYVFLSIVLSNLRSKAQVLLVLELRRLHLCG